MKKPYGAGMGGFATRQQFPLGGVSLAEAEASFGQVAAVAASGRFHMKPKAEPLDNLDGAVVSSSHDESHGSGRAPQGGDKGARISGSTRGRSEGRGSEGSHGADRQSSGSGETISGAGDGAGAVGPLGGKAAAERVEDWCGMGLPGYGSSQGPQAVVGRLVEGNPGPEAERAVESPLEPQEVTQAPEVDPELDRQACKAVGIEPVGWAYDYKLPSGWYTSALESTWDKAERVRAYMLDQGNDTRSVRSMYPAVSTCPIASAQLCQAAIVAGLGWPVALARYINGVNFVGYLQEIWSGNRLSSGWCSPAGNRETRSPQRAIALAVAAAGEREND